MNKQRKNEVISDKWFSKFENVNRLYHEYKTHGRLIIALDFDGTIHDFHNEGNLKYDRVVSLIKRCVNLNCQIVIFTCNTNYKNIKTECNKLGIKIDGINYNILPQFDNSEKKIFYNILLDDRAGLFAAYDILKSTIDRIEMENIQQGNFLYTLKIKDTRLNDFNDEKTIEVRSSKFKNELIKWYNSNYNQLVDAGIYKYEFYQENVENELEGKVYLDIEGNIKL